MAILIKGVSKSNKDCYNCPFNNSNCWCNITKSEIDRDDYTTEIPCPIIEIPDSILDFFQKSWYNKYIRKNEM